MSETWPAWMGKPTKKKLKALARARREFEESETYVCPLGCCEHTVHPRLGVTGGVGPVGCPYGDDFDADKVRATWTLVDGRESREAGA